MQPLTYQLLLDQQTRNVELLHLNQQTASNRATALRTFLRTNALHLDDVVGSEMRRNYPASLKKMMEVLLDEGRTARSVSNTRSALRHFRDAVVEHDTSVALAKEQPTPFMEAIKSVIGDLPVKQLSKQVGIPQDMLRGWLYGKQPRVSNVHHISRLEMFFGLEKNQLVAISGAKLRNFKSRRDEVPTINEYNKTVSTLTQQPYVCKPAIHSDLRKQWRDFLKYKTAAAPGLSRTKRGKWRLSPCPLTVQNDTNWWAFLDGKEVSSARFSWFRVASYLGWLKLPAERGGKDFSGDTCETLAWLAIPEYLEEHLDWWKERVGKRNQGVTTFLALIASLVRPRYGYLWQSEKMRDTLPKQYQSEDWKSLCERQFRLVEQLVSAFHGEIEPSRDSFEPVRDIISLPQPMEAAIEMVQRMRAARPIGGSSLESVWARDMALIKILLSNPLRRRNLAHLTWRADNTGELYQRQDRSWWIRVPKVKFKNRNGAAGDSTYDVRIQESAWRDIERYIFTFRPKLLKHPTDLVFLTRLMKSTTQHVPWVDLSQAVCRITAKYIPRCNGFRAHAFRHLVATAILKSKGGTHKTAAKILNDRVATVEKHYDGLTSNDASEEMTRLLGSCFDRM